MSKSRVDPTCEISSDDVLRRTERHPACRQHEARSGFGTERENLVGDVVWRAIGTTPREKAQAATTARPKVLMRRRGADCLVVVRKAL